MSEKQRRLVFIGFGIFGILVLVILVLSFLPGKKQNATSLGTNQVNTTPQENPTWVKSSLIKAMPVDNDSYSIEYLKTSDQFLVTIKKNPYKVTKKTVETWLKNQGVVNQNSLNIIWWKDTSVN
ncbi:MAG: hypothetical protein M1150_03805 [Patescibacteria group bacterium]|nr:hypothetical protein [Patescibacteria group bacterium]